MRTAVRGRAIDVSCRIEYEVLVRRIEPIRYSGKGVKYGFVPVARYRSAKRGWGCQRINCAVVFGTTTLYGRTIKSAIGADHHSADWIATIASPRKPVQSTEYPT